MAKREVICGIYKIENIINGKVYIGQSINIYKRWSEHKRNLNNVNNKHPNDYLQKSWDKYGRDNFTFEIIEKCSVANIDEKEILYIQQYKSHIRTFGYNIELGGCYTKIMSEETKRKISIANKNPSKETRLKISIGNTGKRHGETRGTYSIDDIKLICRLLQSGLSPSTINKEYGYSRITVSDIKNKKTWKYISYDYNFENIDSYSSIEREVVQYDLSFNKISEYRSIKEASNKTNTCACSIDKSCNNKQKMANEFIWFYKCEDTEENILVKKAFVEKDNHTTEHFNKAIIQIDKDGSEIREWVSAAVAGRELNIDNSSIAKNCKGKLKQVKGFYFKYA